MRWKNGRGNSEIEYDKTCRRKTVAGFVYARYNGLQQTETRKEGADMAVHVRVVPYDSCWPELFRREAEAVGRILGSNRKEIHHIGSTAVTGLAAKPVIDMMPVVWELEAVEACYAQFEAIGYEGMGELGIPGRRYFRKGGDDRTHQIHIFCADSQKDIDRQAAAYGALKLQLARQFPEDLEGDCEGKDAFVKQLEQRALAWVEEQKKFTPDNTGKNAGRMGWICCEKTGKIGRPERNMAFPD